MKQALIAYGFNGLWVDLVMKLVSSVSYKYKVNGFLSQSIIPQRGLRQGDPLYPYLFILVADVLSHMIIKAQEQNRIQGITWGDHGPVLTHLFFADDALLFARASPEEVYQLVTILNCYSMASGQKINVTKSGLICGKLINPILKQNLARILNMRLWENPGKYLGLPGDWGRVKTSALAWLKERILAKLVGWKENLLNQAGKEVLIKAVIQAVPSYVMSIVRFPKNFCRNLCSQIATFWWSPYGRQRGIHWKRWEILTTMKKEGGMGFKEFELMNSALLAKQAWRMLQDPDSLWCSVLKAKYFQNLDFSKARRTRGGSWAWSSLLHGHDVVLKSGVWLIANGKDVDIRGCNWVADGGGCRAL